MEKGTYLIIKIEDPGEKYLITVTGQTPFLRIAGSFSLTEFIVHNKLRELNEDEINGITNNPQNYVFKKFETVVNAPIPRETEGFGIQLSEKTWNKLKDIYCSMEEGAAIVAIGAETKLNLSQINEFVIPKIKQMVLHRKLIL